MFKRLISTALLIGFCFPLFLHSDNIDLPSLGDSTSGIISLEEEHKMGRLWLEQLRGQVPEIHDPLVREYLQDLMYQLVVYSELQDRRLEFVIIQDPQLNAFAAPGGIIGVNTGLFHFAHYESEFVSVMAHELAHLSQRHFARRMESQQQSLPLTIAGILAGIALIATGNGDAGMAAILGSHGVAAQNQLANSRAHEQEADRVGIRTMAKAGYDPRAMPRMFERMHEETKYLTANYPPFLMTHPVSQDRVADTMNRANQYPTVPAHQDTNYQFIRARVRVIQATDKQKIAEKLDNELFTGKTVNKDASKYGLALAELELENYDKAEKLLKELSKKYKGNLYLQVLAADLYARTKRVKEAYVIISDLLNIMPENAGLKMILARIYTETDQTDKSNILLKDVSIETPNQPYVWYALAENAKKTQDTLNFHRYSAKFFRATGRYPQAITEIKLALKLSKDNFPMTALLQQELTDIRAIQSAQSR